MIQILPRWTSIQNEEPISWEATKKNDRIVYRIYEHHLGSPEKQFI